MLHDNKPALDELHPSIWRASHLARGSSRCIDSGHAVLASQLPGGGWPAGELTELLVSQPGVGELRLLAPAMSAVAKRGIMLVQPPHPPQTLAFAALGIPPPTAHMGATNQNRRRALGNGANPEIELRGVCFILGGTLPK